MTYIENPKTKGSGILCAIPQTGRCPNECADCFFQSSRSYLEPLDYNLPNMPSIEQAEGRIVRVNDGNDSGNRPDFVIGATDIYKDRFFNTAIPGDLEHFPGPVVFTANPGAMTDEMFLPLKPTPRNLMFVRARVNTWNLHIVDQIVEYYTKLNWCSPDDPEGSHATFRVPVVLTFMAYFDQTIPEEHAWAYTFRKRTLNSYHAITTAAWRRVMELYQDNKLVYSCGKIEGEKGDTHCRFCGNCVREYWATKERMRG